MKNWLLLSLLTMVAVTACNKSSTTCEPSDVKTSNAVIIGQDLNKCSCCWGWVIQIDNTTYKFGSVPAGTIDLENSTYPMPVKVSWRQAAGNCPSRIDIVHISQ